MKELDSRFEKIRDLMTSPEISERRLGCSMVQQLGFLSARDFVDWYCSSANYGTNHALLLILFSVPHCTYYGGMLADYRFRRIRSNARCPVRTKPILTRGEYDPNFLRVLFATMNHYGQEDVTVANEKGWLLTPDASEYSWNYKVGEDNGWYLAGMKNISWK